MPTEAGRWSRIIVCFDKPQETGRKVIHRINQPARNGPHERALLRHTETTAQGERTARSGTGQQNT